MWQKIYFKTLCFISPLYGMSPKHFWSAALQLHCNPGSPVNILCKALWCALLLNKAVQIHVKSVWPEQNTEQIPSKILGRNHLLYLSSYHICHLRAETVLGNLAKRMTRKPAWLFTSSLKFSHHLKLTLETADNVGCLHWGQTLELIRPHPSQSLEEFRKQLITALPAIKGHAVHCTSFSCSTNHHLAIFHCLWLFHYWHQVARAVFWKHNY